MFEDVRTEVTLRVTRLNDFVALIRNAETPSGAGADAAADTPASQGNPSDSAMRDAKGLVFVHLYGTYEWCLVNAVREANIALQAHGLVCAKLRPSLFSLAFNAELDSIQDGFRGDRWQKRIDVFTNVFCSDPIAFAEDIFPNDGTHMRISQIQTIWNVFGVTDPVVPHPRMIGRVQELVSHRNEIAHGRVRADEVGRRFSVADLQSRIQDVHEYCLYIVSALEDHVGKPEVISRA